MEPGSSQCQVQRQWEQTEMQKVPFENQEILFSCENWHRLARKVVESPSLEVLKKCLDTVWDNWFWMVLPEQGD